jgi:hypothetical protein
MAAQDTGAIPIKNENKERGNPTGTGIETVTGTETTGKNQQSVVINTFHGHIYHIWILILILTRGF